jgi:hypothetical protein
VAEFWKSCRTWLWWARVREACGNHCLSKARSLPITLSCSTTVSAVIEASGGLQEHRGSDLLTEAEFGTKRCTHDKEARGLEMWLSSREEVYFGAEYHLCGGGSKGSTKTVTRAMSPSIVRILYAWKPRTTFKQISCDLITTEWFQSLSSPKKNTLLAIIYWIETEMRNLENFLYHNDKMVW